MTRRVAVTGMGIVSSYGCGFGRFWNGLAAGQGAIRPISSVPATGLRFSNGAEAVDFSASDHFSGKDADLLDRFAQLAAVAAREAVTDAGLELTSELREQTAVVLGCCSGGKATEEDQFRNVWVRGGQRMSPLTIPRAMGSAATSRVSLEHGFTGPAYTVSTACASANHAIGQAFWLVRNGAAEVAVTGGSEAPFSPGFLMGWDSLRVVSPDTCRPFSRDRRGLILGEGAAMLVLEPLERAVARGARIWGEIAGFGMSSDAEHLTHPSALGASRAMTRALADAGQLPEAIGYVNAHGTGTVSNDKTESAAIRMAFGAHASNLQVSATKSMHGHALGAAGAIEAVATLATLKHGVVPPTANFNEADRDPECDLDVVPNRPRMVQHEWALSNSFAFGGLNAVLVFRAH